MGQNDLQSLTRIQNVVIENFGDKLLLPVGMTPDEGIDALERFKKHEQQVVAKSETFDVFPWDGAAALDRVLKRKLGWTEQKPINTMFGQKPPELRTIDTDWNKTIRVPWGRIGLANVDGELMTSYEIKDGRVQFALQATVKRKFEPWVEELFAEIRTECKENSIYRGKAIRIRFFDDDGDLLELPEPRFLRTDNIDDSTLVYSDDVMSAIQTSLFTPIRRIHDCIANDIPVKRGVLLAGPFGTGKTLAAHVASKYAVEAGVTFIYIDRASDLAEAIKFARQYPNPGVAIFCEDIDRVFAGADGRNVEVDDILNTIDGIDSKSMNLVVVLTTNAVENISKAMLRPGRLDAVIDVSPPDAAAVQRLLRVYGKTTIDPNEDLTEVGAVLGGKIPAVIAEVVKRAKLSQLSLQEPGTKVERVSAAALLDAARTMDMQLKLLNRESDAPSDADKLFDSMSAVVGSVVNGTKKKVDDALENTRALGRNFGVAVN